MSILKIKNLHQVITGAGLTRACWRRNVKSVSSSTQIQFDSSNLRGMRLVRTTAGGNFAQGHVKALIKLVRLDGRLACSTASCKILY